MERVRNRLLGSAEYLVITQPLFEMIQSHFQTWLRRSPNDEELRRVFARLHDTLDRASLRRHIEHRTIPRFFGVRPLALEMDITNQCNLRCVMCMFSHPDYYTARRDHWTPEEFGELASALFSATHRVSLSFGTEPLLHKDIESFFDTLREHRIPHTYLNTNGLLLGDAVVESMIDSGFSSVLVSVDAATRSTYEEIRVGGDWDRLMSNLKRLQARKEETGSRNPSLALGFVLMRQNLLELPAFVDLAADLGAIGVNVTHMVSYTAIGNGHMGAAGDRAACNRVLSEARTRAERHGIRFVAPRPFGCDSERREPVSSSDAASRFALQIDPRLVPEPACPFPWSFIGIDKDRKVVPCGWWFDVEPLGDLRKQSFLEIWNGVKLQELRQSLTGGRTRPPCSKCPAAGMGDPDEPGAFDAVG